MVVNLLPHQKIAIEKMHNGCVLTGGVGTGKTVTSLAYFWLKELHGFLNDLASIKESKDIYIFTTARKRDDMDWQDWGVKFGLYRDKDLSTAGIAISVDSYNNIEKYKDVKNAFIILDEQRMVGSGKWSKTFIKMAKSNRWIMLSATPGDRWEDYIPLFIANGFYKNRTEFVRDHCVYSHFGNYPKLERYIGVNKLVKLKNQILVPMPYERHTKRHIKTVPVEYDKELFEKVVKKRWNPYTEKPLKDVAELYSVMRKLVNSDSSRLKAIESLMQKHPKLIVFYTFNYELDLLRSFASSMQAMSSTSSKNFKDLNENSKTSLISENYDTTLGPPDPWVDTIWAKDYIPKPGEKDPRLEVDAIKAKYKFDRDHKRKHPSIFEEPAWTTQNSTTSSKTSTSTTTHTHYPNHMPFEDTRYDHISTSSISTSNPLIGKTRQSGKQEFEDHIPRSSLTESNLSEPIPVSSTSSCSDNENSTSKQLSQSRKSAVDLDQPLKLQKNLVSPSSWSGSTDEPYILGTSDHSELLPKKSTVSPKLTGTGENTTNDTHTSNGSIEPVLTNSPGMNYGPLQVAEWNGQKHEPVPTSDRWLYFVQYAAGSEAWNCVETDAMVFYSRTYVYRQFHQSQGRIDRLNTPFVDLFYYDLASKSYIDLQIGKALRNKEDFNEMKDMKVMVL